jgi:glycosyltransferase involved in cell wall biosynthesis
MRVAIVVWDLSVSGGTQRQALEFARYLKRNRHEVKLYSAYLDRSKCYPSLIEGLDAEALFEVEYAKTRNEVTTWVLHPLEPFFPSEEKRLARMIPSGFDIVNCHDQRAYRTAYYYKHRTGAPVLWMMNDLPKSLSRPRWRPGARGVFDRVHNVAFGGPVGRFLDVQHVRTLDRVAVLDKGTSEAFRSVTGLGATVVRSGLDPKAFDFRQKPLAASKAPLVILAVGIFFPHRRFEDLVNAASELVKGGLDVRVDIVGSEDYDKEYSGQVRALVSRLGLEDRVRFVGPVSEAELRRMYSESDAFVFPNFPQTWGLAVFEAMASGTPTVVSTGCGASEILADGENALLVPPGRPDMIASQLRRLFTDRALYSKLSSEGRRFVEKSVSWDSYGDTIMKLFADAGAGKKGAP